MPEPLRSPSRDQLPKDMTDLCEQVELLPAYYRDKLAPMCDRVGHLLRLQGRLVRVAQEAVDQLQLDVKYLLFDLEVTRRERDAFQQELDGW